MRRNAICLLKVLKAAGSVPPPSAPVVVLSDISFMFFTFHPPRVPVAVSVPFDQSSRHLCSFLREKHCQLF